MERNSQEHKREPRRKRPLNAVSFEELALAYVARFATSAAKLERYLHRKFLQHPMVHKLENKLNHYQ